MFVCKIENTRNDLLTLTQNESEFQVYKIDGLNPPKAQINTMQIAGLDGGRYNSSVLGMRNVVIFIKLNGDVEANRIRLYSFFRSKEWCKFYYKNGKRDVYIEGYVETVEVDPFTDNEIMEVSIVCPNPYFKAVQEIVDDISKALAAFEFPFAIDIGDPIPFSSIDTSRITNVFNDSESDTGVIIEIEVVNSCNRIQIRNVSTGDNFIINYPFVADDKIIINTNKGEKSVRLIRNATTSNLFVSMLRGSVFFQLTVGDNYFSYLVDNGTNDEAIQVRFKHYNLYGGV